MGSRQDVVELQQGVIERGWLLLPHVQNSPCDDTVFQCLLQGNLVVEVPTGCVQEDGRGLHHGVLALADHPSRLIRQRDMERHEIGLFQQLIQPNAFAAPSRDLLVAHHRVMDQDAHVEAELAYLADP